MCVSVSGNVLWKVYEAGSKWRASRLNKERLRLWLADTLNMQNHNDVAGDTKICNTVNIAYSVSRAASTSPLHCHATITQLLQK